MRFKDIKPGQSFFESATGEYYIKLMSGEAVVYDANKRTVDPTLTCEFPENHEVEQENV